ncbi:pyrroline-5-carboxylate reductase [Acanthopleuribacter pedis]|uniref:Pyrroline-5-carboxylate reductase n=1 Tax=Acanthopleuribacter pedis TaxID=442870 RepID=A0A8J7Q283_9BACT|nr:pyrroline-5-carboxylate reductase [Acanthopleuribacter pedis]MBO1316962.1 pyrroline-5-carboxylate reductase [Acanthopleuribacter pedis]
MENGETLKQQRIAVIGAGVMGCALIKGMLAAGRITRDNVWAVVATSNSQKRIAEELGIRVYRDLPVDEIAQTDTFLICTKPYRVVQVLDQLKASKALKPSGLVVSIAAGTTIKQIETALPNYAVIRAMPNTPSLIRAGVTVLAAGSHSQDDHMLVAQEIFQSVGKVWQLDERHLDAVTAVSGSGPAYIYLILESLADGAVKVGLPRDIAFQLVSQTMLGAAMMVQDTGKHPATLKDEVTTPAGCTISALLTMEDGRIRSTLARAVEEATRTAAGLGNA